MSRTKQDKTISNFSYVFGVGKKILHQLELYLLSSVCIFTKTTTIGVIFMWTEVCISLSLRTLLPLPVLSVCHQWQTPRSKHRPRVETGFFNDNDNDHSFSQLPVHRALTCGQRALEKKQGYYASYACGTSNLLEETLSATQTSQICRTVGPYRHTNKHWNYSRKASAKKKNDQLLKVFMLKLCQRTISGVKQENLAEDQERQDGTTLADGSDKSGAVTQLDILPPRL